jgi:hypothetical protein
MISLPYNDNTLKAWEVENHPGYVGMEWVYPGERPYTVFRSFKKVEKAIQQQGFKGWLMASEWDHENMQRHILKVGGKPFSHDVNHVYFKKEFN